VKGAAEKAPMVRAVYFEIICKKGTKKTTVIVHTFHSHGISCIIVKHGAKVTVLMTNNGIKWMAYFSGLFGEHVLAFDRAFVTNLFSSNADTPIGTAMAADFLMI
jgi:hypothetical protein